MKHRREVWYFSSSRYYAVTRLRDEDDYEDDSVEVEDDKGVQCGSSEEVATSSQSVDGCNEVFFETE